MALNTEQLYAVIEAKKSSGLPLMVGFNRRFAPVSVRIKKEFESNGEPIVVNIRVNAGLIPKGHWIQDPETGGGRIVGEVCHFIDLMQFFTGAEPVSVFAESINSSNSVITPSDNFAAVIKFSNGSVGNLVYLANGDSSLPKEHIEVSGGGVSAVINDFREGTLYRAGKTTKIKSSGKGHREEIQKFVEAIKNGNDSPIDFRSVCLTTLTTFRINDSLSTGLPQEISL
jgi:polar amino acid transport system substrate-binding protein